MLTLPERFGPKPLTTDCAPHEQLDQTPSADVYAALKGRAFDFPDVDRRPSAISVPGAEALWLTEVSAHRCAEAFMVGNEFAHVHPPHDGSMHMMLPRDAVEELLGKGWGEPHPMALIGVIPPTAVMVFGPRDDAEVEIIMRIIETSYRFAADGPISPA